MNEIFMDDFIDLSERSINATPGQLILSVFYSFFNKKKDINTRNTVSSIIDDIEEYFWLNNFDCKSLKSIKKVKLMCNKTLISDSDINIRESSFGNTIQLMGVSLRINNFNLLKIDSFVDGDKNRKIFDSIRVENSNTTQQKKSHLLQLMIDEMAIELLKFKRKVNERIPANIKKFDESVTVRLQDDWKQGGGQSIVSSLTFPESMRSKTLYMLMTGFPSYYTKFGFNEFVHFDSDKELNSLTAQDIQTTQINELRYNFECFSKYLNKPVIYDDKNDCHKLMDRINMKYGYKEKLITYDKHFSYNFPVWFLDAHGMNKHLYNIDQYITNILKKGNYPKLKTITPLITYNEV